MNSTQRKRRLANNSIPADMLRMFARRRLAHAHRFSRDFDWLRLSLLGSTLLTLSVLGVANALSRHPFFSESSGSPAIFAGAAIILFIAKIGRTELYVDWMVSGAFYVGVGLSIFVGEGQDKLLSQFPFSIFLMASAIVRIWIGLTSEPRSAGAWLGFSGGIGLAGGFTAFLGWALQAPFPSLPIVAADLLLLAVSVAGFAFALRDGSRSHSTQCQLRKTMLTERSTDASEQS